MIPAIQVRRTPDGRIQARRKDGGPLTPEDREYARRMAANSDPRGVSPVDDPILAPGDLFPEFHRLHNAVVHETPDLDYGWVRRDRPDLYRRIKTIEDRIDGIEETRLSLIIGIMSGWRELILRAEFEQREARGKRT